MNQILVYLAVLVVAITLGLIAVDRLARGVWRTVLIGLFVGALVIGMRGLFLDNDASWLAYQRVLGKGIISRFFNEQETVNNQVAIRDDSFLEKGPYFVLGTSQIKRMLNKDRPISFLTSSGLSPWEYPFFIPEILAIRPRGVILYFSELDITSFGKKYDFSKVRKLPENHGYLFFLLGRYIFMSSEKEYADNSEQSLMGRFNKAGLVVYENLFPEVKYGVIFQKMLEKSLKLPLPKRDQLKKTEGKRSFGGKVVSKKKTVKDSQGWRSFEEGLRSFREFSLGPVSHVEKNFLGLDVFIGELEKAGIEVIILEGQYLPKEMSASKGIERNKDFREGLLPIVRRHANALFVPREEQFQFTAAAFHDRDTVHMEGPETLLYIEYLEKFLRQHFGL